MTDRLGAQLYRLGTLLAVIAILGAVSWNGWTIYQRQQVKENFNALFKDDLGSVFAEEALAHRPAASELPAVLTEQYKAVRASTENLRRSMTYGGFLIIAGLIAYALGWAARVAGRQPNNKPRA